MLNRPKRNCLNTTADILNSLKEGSDSGSMVFCMAAFVSVLLLQKELEEDLLSASPATRYSIFSVLCLCVLGFALHAYAKATRERGEKIKKEEEVAQLISRLETLEAKVATLEAQPGVFNKKHDSGPLSLDNSLTIPLLLNR